MSPLPVVSARDAIRAFQALGYDVDHQTGSHVILRQASTPFRRLTVPNHKELAKGTLRSLNPRGRSHSRAVYRTALVPLDRDVEVLA